MSKLYDHAAVSYACFQPRPGPTLPVTHDGRPVDLALDDGTPLGAYTVCHHASAPMLFILHGAEETIADQLATWPAWAKAAGANLFLLDWPGFASSGGSPSFSACREAARKGLDYLLEQSEAEVNGVVVLGRSLGCVFAIDLFREGASPRLRGLILEGGITDVADWVADRVPWDQTQFNPEDVMTELDEALHTDFRLQQTLTGLGVPVLVVHGLLDSKVPTENARVLADWAGTQRLVLLETGDHDTLPQLNAERYQHELKQFLAEVAPRERY